MPWWTGPEGVESIAMAADESEPESRLRRVLGLRGAVVVGVGAMLGTGVFAVWTPAYALAGSGLLISLVLAAVIAALNAASTARLAAVLPQAGGAYAYGRAVLGRGAGVLAGYAFVIGKSASAGAAALTIGAYLWPDGARWLALVAIAVVLALDLRGVTRSARVTAISIVIVLGVLAVLAVSFWATTPADTAGVALEPVAPHGFWGVLAGAGIMFVAFAGYARITVLGEEVRNPRRTIPRAVAISFLIVLTVYAVLGVTVIAARDRIGGLGDAALDTIARAVVGDGLAWAVTVAAVLAAGAVLLSLIAGIGRTVFAMGAGGDAPRGLAAVSSATGVPYRAEILAACLAAAVVLIGGLGGALALSGASILVYYSVAHVAAWRRWPGSGIRGVAGRAVAGLGLIGCLAIAATLTALTLVPLLPHPPT